MIDSDSNRANKLERAKPETLIHHATEKRRFRDYGFGIPRLHNAVACLISY